MNEEREKQFFQNAVDRRLSGIQENPFLAQRIIACEKGEETVMKKKISVSLVLVLVLMLLSLSIGYALVHSRIASEMYGQAPVPQEMAERIQQPLHSAETEWGSLCVDEVLYDGSALHTAFTISNPTKEPLLYTVDGLWLDGQPLTRSTLLAEGAGTAGLLLGGTVDGVALPESGALYNRGEALYHFDENGKYLGQASLPEGRMECRLSVAVWRPVNQPRIVDYKDYEGENVTEIVSHLVTDEQGWANLELFRPERYQLNSTANLLSSQLYGQAYRELGWAECVGSMELAWEVELDREQLSRLSPTRQEYQVGEVSVTITSFSLTHAGGSMEGWVSGEASAVKAYLEGGLYLADKAGNRVLNYGCWYEDDEAEQGTAFRLAFDPVAGDLPEVVYLAPFVAHDPHWDEHSVSFDPAVPEPDNVIGAFQLDLSQAIEIELQTALEPAADL